MIEIVFNNGKHQKHKYYWVSRKDIDRGEYERRCKEAFVNNWVINVREFKEILIVTTTRRLDHDIKQLTLPNSKATYTYTEIARKLEIYEEFTK